jgi:hypothetical protein
MEKDDRPPDGNQAEYWRKKLRPQVDRMREDLASGIAPSEIANRLLREDGLGTINIIMVFCQATGASLGDVKLLGQWWSHRTGVTDASALDEWAAQVFARH